MDWYKTKVKYTLYSELSDKEFRAYHLLMALTAQLETMPTETQMLKVCHHKTLKSLQEKLKEGSTSLQGVLKKVLSDVQGVINKKEYWKEKKRQQREKLNDVQETSLRGQHIDKIRVDKIKYNNTKGGKFIPPSLQEVSEYCNERNNNVNPETFIDFYSSKGWMVGKSKMKDWRASVRTWEKRREGEKDGRYKEGGISESEAREYLNS